MGQNHQGYLSVYGSIYCYHLVNVALFKSINYRVNYFRNTEHNLLFIILLLRMYYNTNERNLLSRDLSFYNLSQRNIFLQILSLRLAIPRIS